MVETRVRRHGMPRGLEPMPTGGISHLTVLRNRELSLLCLPAGDFATDLEPPSGLYFHDARHLSRFVLTICGERPVVLDSHDRGHSLSATLTNPPLRDADGHDVPGQSIMMRRLRVLTECLSELLVVSNYGHGAVRLTLDISLGADFADIFVIRGYERKSEVPPVAVDASPFELAFRYAGQDGELRGTTCLFHPEPRFVDDTTARFELALAPGESTEISLTIRVDGKGEPQNANAQLAVAAAEDSAWIDRMTRVETDDEHVNDILTRALLDVRSLLSDHDGIPFVAAGVPWFDAVFGRDSLITGMELLGFSPEPLRNAIRLMAQTQAAADDAFRDAEPGKIAHELRLGELANIGEVPFGAYYGSIDSTPLFVIACLEYLRWTGDADTVVGLWPAIEAAIGWCRARAARHPLGLLAYDRQAASGLEHQGWKDSEDGICRPDGSPVRPPVALIEVQAYLAAAYSAYGALCRRLGRPETFDGAEACAAVTRVIAQLFFSEGEQAVCLDAHQDPVFCPTSNPGHVLWARACSAPDARRIASRLMMPDLFNGWGIRTLGSSVRAYNPLGYHIGTVWPHDNAIILAGFRHYGLRDELATLGDAMFEAALRFPGGRVPELFCGDARDLRGIPTPYPVASRPQAWSAGSVPSAFFTLLGITPGPDGNLYVTSPVLPAGLEWVRVKNLRFGRSSTDLVFRRYREHVGIEVERQAGPASVVLSAEWPYAPLREP